jgi:hypothetical protein
MTLMSDKYKTNNRTLLPGGVESWGLGSLQ